MAIRGWTQAARDRGLATRRAKRDARRGALGLPLESIGQGKPRRGAHGEYVPRGSTPLEVATLEVRFDIAQALGPARFMARTHYKLRRDEFEIYRAQWSTIKQAILDAA